MATWVLTQGSSTITFNSDPFWLMEATGVGSAPVRRLSQRGPLQDGVSDLGYRLEPRMITLSIMIVGTSKSATDGHRDTLATLLKPSSTPLALKYTRDDAAVRQIDCYVVNQVDMPAQRGERFGFWQRVVVQLVAPDPLWYDPTAGSASAGSFTTTGWQLAKGTVASGNVDEYVLAPTQGQAWGAGVLDTYSDFTIALRSSKNAASSTDYAWTVYYNANDSMWLSETEYVYRVSGSNMSMTSIWPDASSHNIIITGTWASGRYQLRAYRDGVLLATSTWTWITINFTSSTKKWRSDSAGANGWIDAVTRAAVYNIALNETQVTALSSTLTSGDTTTASASISYAGTADEYPILTLTGPVTSPIVTNGATGDVLDFTGYTLAASTTLTIDLRYGYKTVTDSAGVNRIDELTSDSDLTTWRLVSGTNAISFEGGSTSGATALQISYYNRYLSQ